MSVTLEISDDLAHRLQSEPKVAEAELRLEVALALYRQGKLPPGLAARMASLTIDEFEQLLRTRHVPMPYSLSDLEHDIAYASGSR